MSIPLNTAFGLKKADLFKAKHEWLFGGWLLDEYATGP